MKKILVLTMMVLLACSMSVMASDITITGETLFEWFGDFSDTYGWNGDAEIDVKAALDEFTTAEVKIEYVQGGASGSISETIPAGAFGGGIPTTDVPFDADVPILAEAGPSYIELNRGYFTTAVGKYAGLEEMGVTITLDWGYYEFDDPSYGQITAYAIEDVWEAKSEDWAVGVDVGIMDIVHVEFASAPQPGQNQTMFGVYGGMDPVWVSVYYDRNGSIDLAKGLVGATALAGMDIMPGMFAFKAAVNFAYYMDEDIDSADDDLSTQKYWLSGAIHTDIMDMAYVDVAFIGQDDSIFEYLFFALGAGYMDMVGVDVGIGLILDEDACEELFDEFDAAIWTKVGMAKFRVGYIMHTDQKLYGNFYQGLDKNLAMNIAYDPAVAENGVIYFGGEVDY